MSGRRLRSIGIWAIIIGLALVGIGSCSTQSTPPAQIMCGDDVMAPGDTCISTSSSHSGTYEERRQRDIADTASARRSAPGTMLIGGIVAGVGLVVLIGSLVSAPRAHPSPRPQEGAEWWVEPGDER